MARMGLVSTGAPLVGDIGKIPKLDDPGNDVGQHEMAMKHWIHSD